MRYYIADCHFGHERARLLDKRPFATVEEMDRFMIAQWNETVRPKKDEVVILGDLCTGKGEQANALLRQLNGRKYLVRGNHDMRFLRDKKFNTSLLGWVKSYTELRDNGRRVVLCHYPVICYNGQYNGDSTYMLYGHVHNTLDYQNVKRFQKETKETICCPIGQDGQRGEPRAIACNMINCFAAFSDYRPLTLDQWIDKQKEKDIRGCSSVDKKEKLCYDGSRCEEKKK